MKKTIAAMVMAMMCAGVAVAQKSAIKKPVLEKVTPPDVVLNGLKEKYTGELTPVWSKNNNTNFIAHIDSSSAGNRQYIEFSPEGKWLNTATVVSFEQLSEAAQKKIKEQYAEMQIAVVKKIEREGISAFYKVKLIKDKESKTVYVNDAGFVSE
jgi:Putative beta-lactamase-inhibitor-like, PepSY-like